MSSVDQAASSLEEAHLTNAGLAGDGFGADGTSPHVADNGDFFEQPGELRLLLYILWPCVDGFCLVVMPLSCCNASAMSKIVEHQVKTVCLHELVGASFLPSHTP